MDRHGQWDRCHRCGYPGQITRAAAYGGFLSQQPDGSLFCWDGRECALRFKRKQRKVS
jgi:hypothetical protein